MKNTKFTLLVCLSLTAFASACSRENIRINDYYSKPINFNISAVPGDLEGEDGKVALDGKNLIWTGNENMSVIFGGSSSTTAATGLQATIPTEAGTPGHFSGTVTPGDWTIDDIKGVVVPAELGSFFNYNSGTNWLVFNIPATQVQAANGEINPANIPLFYPMSGGSASFTTEDDSYSLNALTLQWACGLVRYNIYLNGEAPEGMQDDEIFRSISVRTSNAHIVGECRYVMSGSNTGLFSYSGINTATVELTEEITLKDRTKTDGIVCWLAVMPRGNGTPASAHPSYIESVTITTDKAVYVYVPDEHIALLTKTGRVSQLGVNLAKFTRNMPIEYSTDGGATWSANLPDGTFSKLAVRTPENSPLSSSTLAEIVTAINNQTLVDLDMGGCTYESTQFPAVFKGSAKLGSMVFPSNITTLAGQAFYNCSKLKSVKLDGITRLSASTGTADYYAFGGTALESITIPSSISSYMVRSFYNCSSLKEIRYEASWNPTGTGFNYRTFRVGSDNGTSAKTVDCTVTIGPAVKSLPMSAFLGNNNIVKVTVEGDECVFMNNEFGSCKNLATFELKGMVPPKINNTSAYTSLGANVTGDKKVIIPKGATAIYQAHANWPAWETFMTARGFTLEEAGALPAEEGYLTLASGGSSPYRIVYTSAQATNVTAFASALRNASGALFGASAVSATNATDFEIIVGNTANRTECATALSGINHGFIIKALNGKVVIAGTDEAWTSLALEAFNEKVLKNASYCNSGTLKLPEDYSYSETDDDPQLLARFISGKRSFSIVATLLANITYPANTTYKIAQGAVSDGTYVYFLLKKNESSSILLKYNLKTLEKVAETPFFNAYHANGMTFDSKHNRVVLVHGQGDPSGLSLIDAETLAITDIDISPVLLGGISYNAKRNIYGITRGGTLYKTLDENFVEINDFGRTDETGYRAQDMGSDDTYVYFPMDKAGTDNLLVTYTWDGKYVTAVKVPVTYEIEDMFYTDGQYYAWFYSAGGKLYSITPVLKCNFD